MSPNNASPVEVSHGAQISGITVTLVRTRMFRIKGHVGGRNEKGSRQSGVVLWRGELAPRDMPIGAEVDAQGRFQLDGVAPGSYVLFAGDTVGDKLFGARIPLEVSIKELSHETVRLKAIPADGAPNLKPERYNAPPTSRHRIRKL